ncbi:MAG: hypothetical protein HDR01_14905 [Lachnospiraceae bacterium]|nr:hypothetical protein [Lachnospiraceae bacterium]
MGRENAYFLVQREKRQLNWKELFSFLVEKVQPEEIIVCGEPMSILKLPEFMMEQPEGIWRKIKKKLYEALMNKKMRKLLATTTEEFPMAVMEACLAEFLKKECAFRRTTKVLIADKSHVDFKNLLMPYCGSLNYLEFLVDHSGDYEYLAEEMYEESGLAITFTLSEKEKAWEEIPDSDEFNHPTWTKELTEKYHIVIDLRKDLQIPVGCLAEGCVYFDSFSDKEREKCLRRGGKGITYLSPGIYLDRALKSTV